MRLFQVLALGAALSTGECFAATLVATFDSYSEGIYGTSLTDGGITFFNGKRNVGDRSAIPLSIDDESTGPFAGWPVSSPNFMKVGGFAPGPGGGRAAFHSLDFKAETSASAATIYAWVDKDWVEFSTSLSLQALRNGVVVDFATIDVPLVSTVITLHVSGVEFDVGRLIVLSDSPLQNASVALDNITMTVPEPSSLTLGLAASMLCVGYVQFCRRAPKWRHNGNSLYGKNEQ